MDAGKRHCPFLSGCRHCSDQRIFRQVYPCKLLGDIAAADGNGCRRLHGVMPADKKPGIHRDENYACAISKKGEKVKPHGRKTI